MKIFRQNKHRSHWIVGEFVRGQWKGFAKCRILSKVLHVPVLINVEIEYENKGLDK